MTPATVPHPPTTRPWGFFEVLGQGRRWCVKTITVEPGRRLSLQRHRHRGEWWYVVEGRAHVALDGRTLELHATGTVVIEPLQWHRLENRGSERLVVLEVQTGTRCSEDDIERAEDDYGRAPPG